MFARHTLWSLGALFLFSVMMPISGKATPHSPDTRADSTFVIVHGAWGGSWAFRTVDSLLTERGYDVYRPSLTGQGERVHLASPEVGLSTHIDDVVNMLRFEDLHDVILMGHSYGGMVITGVADRVPERIQRLIFVDAFVPEDGESVLSIQGDGAAGLEQMRQDGFFVPPWVDPDQPPPKDVPQPERTFTERLVLENEAACDIPTTYIHAVEAGQDPEEDGFASQARRARERGWHVRIIESDHNPQWSAPETLVEMLVGER